MATIPTIRYIAYMNLKARLAYRFDFFFWLVVKALSYASGFLIIWLILHRFRGIAGWTVSEVMALWAMTQLTYTIAGTFLMNSTGKLDRFIISGEFDSFLLQPMNPLVNVIARGFTWTYSSQILLNMVVLAIAISHVELHLGKVIFLLATLLGGVAIHAFVFLIGGALSFRWLNTGQRLSGHMRWFIDFTQYPISIYPAGLRWLLTFLVPFALVNYYPCLYLFDKLAGSKLEVFLVFASPAIAIGFGMFGVWLWHIGLSQYQSSGS